VSPAASQVDIFFDHAVLGSAFQFITNGALSMFTAFLNGSLVHSFEAGTDIQER